jgi:membrane-associated phospholipid phosphatase
MLNWWKKISLITIFLIIQGITYSLTTKVHFSIIKIDYSLLDLAIPYISWTVLIYISYYLILVLPLLISKERIFNKILFAYFLVLGITVSIFLFFPTQFNWNLISTDFFTTNIMIPLRIADQGLHAFPSQHVAFSLIGSFVFLVYRKYKLGLFFGLWGLLIAISTLTTKQHFVIDVLGGIAVAVVVGWVVRKM